MFMLKCMILCIILLAVPAFLGYLATYNDNSCLLRSPVSKYILGHLAALSVFWILCVPMALLKISFTALTIVYSLVLGILCIIVIRIYSKKGLSEKRTHNWKRIKIIRFENIYLFLFLLLLCVQLYFAAFYESTVWSYDDFDYVVRSLDTITSDHMFLTDVISGETVPFSFKRVLNSWDIYIAYLSKVSGFHVTTVAHTIIPTFFLLLAYLVYAYIAGQLFDKRENQWIFLCILSVAFIFGLYSPYSLTFRLLVTLWQGKAILSAIILPFLIVFLPNAYIQKWNLRAAFYVIIISMAACSLTLMGSGMLLIIYTVMLILISIYKRKCMDPRYYICGCAMPALQMMLYLVMR